MFGRIRLFVQSKLNLLSLIIKGIGVALLLLSILGFFKHPERINFYETLQTEKELPADLPVAQQLMRDFGVPQEQIILVKKIIVKDLRFAKMGRSIAGTFVAQEAPDRRRTMGDLMGLREWAYSKSKSYEWIGFILVAFGFIIDVALYLRTG